MKLNVCGWQLGRCGGWEDAYFKGQVGGVWMVCTLVVFRPIPSPLPLNVHGMFFCSLVLFSMQLHAREVSVGVYT